MFGNAIGAKNGPIRFGPWVSRRLGTKLDRLHRTHTGPDNAADPIRIDRRCVEPCMRSGCQCRRRAKLGMPIHPARFLATEQHIRLESLDLAGKLCFVVGRVKPRDSGDSGHAGNRSCPALIGRIADRTDRTQPGHYYSFSFCHVESLRPIGPDGIRFVMLPRNPACAGQTVRASLKRCEPAVFVMLQ